MAHTPDNWADLRDSDENLGSAGAILIPGANQVLTAGKSGDLLLVYSAYMEHVGAMNSAEAQSIRANPNGVYGLALWNRLDGSIVYVHEPYGPLQAYRVFAGHLDAVMLSQSDSGAPSLFAGIAVSADKLLTSDSYKGT